MQYDILYSDCDFKTYLSLPPHLIASSSPINITTMARHHTLFYKQLGS